ncbi:hypothetical protein J4526_05500 [Desulfurococcaceae archaeon MEX13E-LK6-19]|nr:hypothetical protein J4526_05500 [Desulfurococcaceae archaeon MEX13E-LK6-19]
MDDEKIIRQLKENLNEILHEIKGGPNKYGTKLKKTSVIFLSMPDPTMISTGIGLSLFTIGKILEHKRDKGIEDLLLDYSIELEEAKELLKKLTIPL